MDQTTPPTSLSLIPEIQAVIQELGFEKLTPIQEKSIPVLLDGQDLIGQSKTGSGKTAAFAIPILQKIEIENRDVQALILCPTRELGTQVAREIRKLGRKFDGLQVLLCSGGQPLAEQSRALAKGVHIVVGTPGRMVDLIFRNRIDLRQVSTLVLDEADEMLDMGFEQDMRKILDSVPQNRQTVFFSATFPASIQKLSEAYQVEPVMVQIVDDESSRPLIDQFAYEFQDEDKVNVLLRVLQQHASEATLIFCNFKATVDELTAALKAQGISAAALHGDFEQRDRDEVMAMFRNGSYRILVATDVAARGLDIENLDLVINYEIPPEAAVYVHRIGRTGRAGRKGATVLLIRQIEGLKIPALEAASKAKMERPVLGFKNQHGLGSAGREAKMQTLLIIGGRKNKLRPGDIVGALTGQDGLVFEQIGKIEVHDFVTYVGIQAAAASKALERLRNGRIKAQKFSVRILGSR